MDAFCPRCKNSLTELDAQSLETGLCPTCGGQIAVAENSDKVSSIAGAVSLAFDPDSNLAQPLMAIYEESSIAEAQARGVTLDDSSTAWDDSTPPPSEEGGLRAPLTPSAPPPDFEIQINVDSTPPFGSLSKSAPPPGGAPPWGLPPGAPPPGAPPPGAPPPGAAAFDASESEFAPSGNSAAPAWDVKTPPQPTSVPAGASSAESGSEPESGSESSSELSSPPAASSDVPAHLQLPNIDFSMPDVGDLPPPSAAATSGADAGALPAHLALPEFPSFELPPIPGAEEPSEQKVEIRGTEGGGSFDVDIDVDAGAAPGSTGEAPPEESWAVAPAATLPPPPPLPPRRRPAAAATPPPAAAAGLPNFALPTFEAPAKKAQVTLVETPTTDEDEGRRRSLAVPLIAIILLVAGAGGAAFWQRAAVMDLLGVGKKPAATLSRADRAMEVFVQGFEAAQADKHKEAISAFERALKIDPTLARAERSLAISYAKLKQQDDAVEHYRRYLKIDPKAEDAAEVRKIIADYEAAKSQGKVKSQPEPRRGRRRR